MSQVSIKEFEILAKAMTVPRLKCALNNYRIAIDDGDRKPDLVLKYVIYHATHRQHPTGSQSPAAAQQTTGAPLPAAGQQTTGAPSPADVEQAAAELQTYGLSETDMIVLFPPNDPIRGTRMWKELQRRKDAHTMCCRVMAVTGLLCIVFANNLYSANAANAIAIVDQNVSFVRWSSECMTYLFTLASVASCCQSYFTWHSKTLVILPIIVIVFSLSMNT